MGAPAGTRNSKQYASATEERVKRGASWLTRLNPTWADAVSLRTFDNESAHHNALGQIYRSMRVTDQRYPSVYTEKIGGYTLARRAWDFAEENPMSRYKLSDLEAIDRGFECVWDSPNPEREAAALNARWVKLISKLKGIGNVNPTDW